MNRRVPNVERLDEHFVTLAQIVAKTSWLPHPSVVRAVNRAVFPTMRNMRRRLETFNSEQGEAIGMFDDNTTPEWAIFWAHGLKGTRPKGWTIAHVWTVSDGINAYTHLANLVMVSEPFASLTDKTGPLTGFLQWHAWSVYNWKPEGKTKPTKPDGYDDIHWRYLKGVDDPKTLILQRLSERDNQRTRILRPIMEKRGLL